MTPRKTNNIESNIISEKKKNYLKFFNSLLVIDPLCRHNSATGAVVCKHQTLITLSQLPAANSVFSTFTAISVISDEAPLNVDNSLPECAPHALISKSSAP